MTQGHCFKRTFQVNPFAIRKILAQFDEYLEGRSLDVDLRSRVELALAELLNNIAEHAYADGQTGFVRLEGEVTKSHLRIAVTDHGKPMPGGVLPDGTLPSVEVGFEDLPEGGFGWHLIRVLSDTLDYERLDGMNHTRLCFKIS